MKERRAYRISGRVQGVGFRWFTRHAAEELGIAGTVRNDPDGTVEVVAIADSATLDDFETRLRSGPALASVDLLDVLEQSTEAENTPSGFRIVR